MFGFRGLEALDSTPPDGAHEELALRVRTEVREIGIPPWPAILRRIEIGADKAQPAFHHLAGLIGLDAGLAGALMKVAGSPPYGEQRRIRSFPDALQTLGVESTVQAVAELASLRMFPPQPKLEAFWRSSARTALVAGWLVPYLGERCQVDADLAYTFGLLRDSGKPLLLIPFPEYGLLQDDDTAEEDALLATNHAALGAALAEERLLPDPLCSAIRHHHNPAAIEGKLAGWLTAQALQLIAIGRMADDLLRSSAETRMPRTTMGAACMRVLGVSERERDRLADICHLSGHAIVASL